MDVELRRSHRSAQADVEAEARLLAERVRSGDLSRARLELAARCEHPGARASTGGEVPAFADAGVLALLFDLRDAGDGARLAAVAALASHAAGLAAGSVQERLRQGRDADVAPTFADLLGVASFVLGRPGADEVAIRGAIAAKVAEWALTPEIELAGDGPSAP